MSYLLSLSRWSDVDLRYNAQVEGHEESHQIPAEARQPDLAGEGEGG